MRIQKDIIFLLGSLLIITIAWVIFTLRHNAVTSTVSETLTQEIVPITPHFNTQIIEKLKTRQLVDPSYTYTLLTTVDTAASSTATPIPSLTPTLTVVPSETSLPTVTLTPTP